MIVGLIRDRSKKCLNKQRKQVQLSLFQVEGQLTYTSQWPMQVLITIRHISVSKANLRAE